MPEEFAEQPLLRVTKTEDMIKNEYVQFHEILSTTEKQDDIQKVRISVSPTPSTCYYF